MVRSSPRRTGRRDPSSSRADPMQAHGTDLWKEPAGNGGTPRVTGAWLHFDGADFVLVTSGTKDARMVPDGFGDFILVDVRETSRAALTASASDYLLATSGSAVAE